jgi:hypothetical protein
LVSVAVGIVLLVMGLREMDSLVSQFSKFFTGSPTDRAVWLTMGGAVLILGGASAAVIAPKRPGG